MTDEAVKAETLSILDATAIIPRLVVFDLDYTLWPFYCESRSKNEYPRLYPEANGILKALKEREIKMAIASRSPTPDIAKSFLHKLNLAKIFVTTEIFPSWTHKTDHLSNISKTTHILYTSMLFFDDEQRNIQAVSKMGVTSVHVDNGLTVEALKRGLNMYSRQSSRNSASSSD